MTVTDVRIRKKGLSALYIDGEYAMELDTDTLEENGIGKGVHLSDDDLHELIEKSKLKRAKNKAMYLLTYRDRSRKELMDKIRRDCDEETARLAVDRMEELGLINDEAFAEKFARELLYVKKYSMRRTEYELMQKGIDRQTADEIIDRLEPDERALIAELIERKYCRKLSDDKGKRQTVSALLRQGYQYEDIMAVIRDFVDENE